MTSELWAALIGAIVLILTNLAALIKVLTDNAKIKSDRADTKLARDNDSKNLHDQCQKNTWEIEQLKTDTEKRDKIVEDLRAQVNELNVNLQLCNQNLANFSRVIEAAVLKLTERIESRT